MPANPRQQIKHDLGRAISHLQWIQEILMHTGEKYRKDHPEITAQYEAVFAFFTQGRELMEGLRETY